MSSKKLLFIISLVIFAASLMSFNIKPEQSENSNSATNLLESGVRSSEFSKTDTLPDDMQKRVSELHQKRERIRKEVQRIKDAEEAKIARKADAERNAVKKQQEKANKEAIAKIKAEEKAKLDAIKKKQKAEKKAAAHKIALEKKRQRELEAVEKAKQDAIAQKEQSKQKAEADKLKAARKIEAERLAQERKKQREAEALLRAEQKAEANRLKAEQDAERKALRDKVAKAQEDVRSTVNDESALKAAQKRDAEIAKAAKKQEREVLKAAKAKEREEKAVLRAQQQAEAAAIAQANANNPNADNEAALKAAKKQEREAIKAAKAKEREEKAVLRAQQQAEAAAIAQANANNPNADNEAAIKAAKKQEREAIKAAKAKEREEKAALRAQEKAEAAAIAAQIEAERKANAEGLVYDEDPPGYETKPDIPSTSNTGEDPRLKAQSVGVANKTEGASEAPEVITEPILPPPPPSNDAASNTSKTKTAVEKAFDKERKRRNRKGGIKLPGIGGKSDVPSEVIMEECDFEFNEFDPITQKVKRGLAHRFFFSYTSDVLKEYMQGEDYLICHGGLIDIQGIIALGIKYEIDSPQARYEYGSISTNAQMILQLIDGETITLLAEQSDSGRVNRSTGKTEFSSIFLINPREEKELRKTEISTVRMVWGTGYEDYEVNELDFLINQFQCIDAARDN